jgi:hypothetical protein
MSVHQDVTIANKTRFPGSQCADLLLPQARHGQQTSQDLSF